MLRCPPVCDHTPASQIHCRVDAQLSNDVENQLAAAAVALDLYLDNHGCRLVGWLRRVFRLLSASPHNMATSQPMSNPEAHHPDARPKP